MLRRLIFLLLAWPSLVHAQITVTNSSFSNGFGTGSDGTITVTTALGSSGDLAPFGETPPPAIAELFISEYIEGSGNNKAIEIFNGTTLPIALSGVYQLKIYYNGSPTPASVISLNGTVAPGQVFVVGNSNAQIGILSHANQSSSSLTFNGNDAVVLTKNDVPIDHIGIIGNDPGLGWQVCSTPIGTSDHTLVRKSQITAGDTNTTIWNASCEWDVYAVDTFNNLGSHSISIGAPNVAPSFVAGPDPSFNEDFVPQVVANWATSISAGSPEESSQTLTFIVSNDNNELFSVQPSIDANGTLSFTSAPNAFGSALVTAVLKDNGGTDNGGVDTSPPQTFAITIRSVNDPPSFQEGPDQVVVQYAGPQTVVNWATTISNGPPNESSQVATFITTNNNLSLFIVQPSIDAQGTLTYTPSASSFGSAVVQVSLRDNGGTANGGVDTSLEKSFTITIQKAPATTLLSDSLALVSFYNATSGPDWFNKTNWLTGPVNTWFGVTVNNERRVSRLELPDNNLIGLNVPGTPIPSSFMTLQGLEVLNLRQSYINELPADFSALSNLTSVDLQECNLFELPSLNGLNALTSFNVVNNHLTFEDLEPIWNLPGITYSPQMSFGNGGAGNIVAGNPIFLAESLEGSANQYQWYKDGEAVAGAITSAYTINNASAADAGQYNLAVTSSIVPGLTLLSIESIIIIQSPGAQTYFSWPANDGIINTNPSASYGSYWVDFDNDEDEDLAINNLQAGSSESIDLFENDGTGGFTRLLNAGLPENDVPRNITWTDYDNDGDLDFYAGDVGFNINSDQKGNIYRNNGDKTFTQVPLNIPADGGSWVDYDNDGLADLANFDLGFPSSLFKNNGNSSFTPSTQISAGSGWAILWADIDNDRDQDMLLVGTETGKNSLYRNDANGTFTLLGSSIVSTDNLVSARSAAWADIDNDGDLDLLALNAASGGSGSSAFYINDGAGNFSKVIDSNLLGVGVRGRGCSFGDINNDGFIDLVINNTKSPNIGTTLFLNDGQRFQVVSSNAQSFVGQQFGQFSQLSLGDANSDGFLDLATATFNILQPPSLYRNVGNGNHWVKFKLEGALSNRSAIGTRVEIEIAGQKQIREVSSQTAFASQNSLLVHFGTGQAATIDQVKILWPSGIVQQLSNVPTNQVHSIVERLLPYPTVAIGDSLALVTLYNATNGLGWTTKTNWLTGPVNTWQGITVANNRVTEISLQSNNLTQTIPDLSALTGLKSLSLALNPFTAQNFPASVFNLTSLETLHLYNCNIQGNLPAGFANLTGLRALNLSGNNLSPPAGQLDQLGTLLQLQQLDLSFNNMSGAFPAAIAALPALTNLNFSNCSFSELPVPTAWASSALQVNLSNNSFDFGDLEPLVGLPYPSITNTGQRPFPVSDLNLANTVKLLVGDPVNLNPLLGGTQNNYQWYLNDNPIAGANSRNYTDLDLQLSDAGVYQLRVTNNLVTGITLSSLSITFQVTSLTGSLFALNTTGIIQQDIPASTNGGYWADIDQDGDEDLFVNNIFLPIANFLYDNQGDGTFQKITTGDIVTVPDGSRYVSWGDYDNDGYPDIFVGEYTSGGVVDDSISSLYRNNGNKTFTRIPFNHKADGGIWADYDNDGDLDLFINVTTTGTPTAILYRNKGDGTFDRIDNWVSAAGTWFAGFVDIDNDGDLDYNVTPTTPVNQIKIFRNNGGIFTEENLPLPAGTFNHRGSSWGDIDGDGDMDLFAMNSIASTGTESQFYINDGTGHFTIEPASWRMGGVKAFGARGSAFGDADNDGDLDLFITHRPVVSSLDVITQLFLNDGGNFAAVTDQSFGYTDAFSGLSLADYNNDGALDLFVGTFEAGRPNYLFRNLQTANGNHWLKLNLVGMQSNKTAIGARVEIFAGGKAYSRQVLPSSGLSGQSSYIVHTGLASAAKADSVVIHWPSGIVQRLHDVNANQQLTIIEGLTTPPTIAASNFVFSNVTTNSMTVSFTRGDGEKRVLLLNEPSIALPASPHGGGAAPAPGGQGQPAGGGAAPAPGEEAAHPVGEGKALPQSAIKLPQITDGTELTGNTDFSFAPDYQGGWKVIYVGEDTSVNVSGLAANHVYAATVIEYNGSGTETRYLNSNAPLASQQTLPDVLPPAVIASNISFSNVFSTQMQIGFTPGDGMKRLVVINPGAPVDFVPVDDVAYTVGQAIGTNNIVMNDTTNPLTTTGLQASTTYYVTVYEYNESGAYSRYLTTGAPVASQLTLPLPNVYVTSPAAGAVNRPITLNVTARALTGATTYTIELNDAADFTGNSFVKSGNRTQNFAGLSYAKTYYTRVRTDLSPDYGQVTSFSTLVPNTFVTSPPNNATNQSTTLNVTSNALTGAILYTIELNEDSYFSGVGFIQTGLRTQNFAGLKNDQQYYARVKTDVYPEFGVTTTFRTAIPNVYVTTPANNSVNQNVNLTVTARLLTGATDYTIELNEAADFSGPGFAQTGARTQNFADLAFGKKYFARVKTDLSPVYGQVNSFSTASPDYFAYVTSPAAGAVNVNAALNITSNTVPGAATYTIQLSEDPDFTIIGFEVTGISRTLAFSGLKYNTIYYNRVRTDLTSEFGQVRQFNTRTAESIAYVTSPANGATNVNNVSLNITANNVPGATAYTIQLSETSDFSTVDFEITGPSRTLAFSGLKYNTTYYNRVITNAPGTLDYGTVRSFTTRAAESLAYVTSPADGAMNVNVNSALNVRSNTVPGAATYTIELSTDPSFSGASIAQSSSTSTVLFSGLAYNTLYYNRVQTDLSPAWGITRSFTTGNPSLNSYITSPANGATNVNWVVNLTANNIPGAATYTIEANTQDDFEGISIVRTGSRTQSFTLQQDQLYYVRVKTDLYTDWGPTRSFTTGNVVSLAYVTNPISGGTGVPTTINVVANALSGATSYTIELNTEADFSGVSLVQTRTTRTINFAGLTEGTTYYSRVMTSLAPGQWGATIRSFTTISSVGRTIVNWMGEDTGEEALQSQHFKVNVLANPFREKLEFIIESENQGEASIELLDVSGKSVHQLGERVNKRIEINKPLPQGVYILRVVTPNEIRAVRVVKMD